MHYANFCPIISAFLRMHLDVFQVLKLLHIFHVEEHQLHRTNQVSARQQPACPQLLRPWLFGGSLPGEHSTARLAADPHAVYKGLRSREPGLSQSNAHFQCV